MPTDTIERVAEAIWQAEWKRAGNGGLRKVPWSEISGTDQERYRFLARALSAALAAGAPGVKVKALDWVKEVADLWWSADCYRIEVFDGGGFATRVRQPRMHVFTTLAFGVSFEAAKATAQADYEARILSALEPAPPARQDGALREARAEYDAAVKGWINGGVNSDARLSRAGDALDAALAQSAAPVQQAAPSGEGE